MIKKIRRRLPRSFRQRLQNATKLSYLIAPLYGYLIIPKFDGSALIFGEGIKILVHPDISAIDCFREIYRNNVYGRYEIKKGDIVIDIGANVGMFTIKAGSMLKDDGLVIAIEPSPQNIEHLKKNIDLHNLQSHCIMVPKAVSNLKGKSKFIVTPVSGQHRLGVLTNQDEPEKMEEIEVETTRLDDVITEMKVNRINFLKMDIEGAELEALKGAEESLKITQHIAMELHYEGEAEEVRSFLEERGFLVDVTGTMLYARNASSERTNDSRSPCSPGIKR